MDTVSLGGRTLPLHPHLTVVSGLDPSQRAALADAVAAAVDDLVHLDGLRAELAAAEAAVRASRATFDAALIDELERAHAEVEAADAAAGALLGRRRARRRADAARALEQALLEGLGFHCYTDALLARLAPGVDLVAEDRLLAARRAVAEATEQRVPMVIDDRVVAVDGDEIRPLLGHLLTSNLQVIWLTDDPLVTAAATGFGPDRAAVVALGPSSPIGAV